MSVIDIVSRFLSQVTSGRWLLTLGVIYCLTKLTDTLCTLMKEGKVTLETATYVAIVMSILNTVGMVAIFYFQKTRPGDGNGNGNGDGVTDITTTDTTTTLPPK